MNMKQYGDAMLNDPWLGPNQWYRPCTTPLRELKPIHSINDLIIESHHYGEVLVVRAFCDAVRVECFANAVEDVNGEVERVAVFNVSINVSPQSLLPKGAILAIKEPFYRRASDGGVVIRIDHPSNLEMLIPSDPLVPDAWRKASSAIPTLEECHAEAAASATCGDWQVAHSLYTDALDLLGDDGDDKTRRELHLGRALARNYFRAFELAAEDCVKAIIPGSPEEVSKEDKPFNYKALATAGEVLYEAGNFVEAKKNWQRALSFATDRISQEEAQMAAWRTTKRIKEQETGVYNFVGIAMSAKENYDKLQHGSHHGLHHASFHKKVRIGDAGHRGRGLFATQDIKHGDLIMVEKAMFDRWPLCGPSAHCHSHTNDHGKGKEKANNEHGDHSSSPFADFDSCTERVYAVWNQLCGNPKLAAAFIDLYDGGDRYRRFEGKKLLEFNMDGTTVVDMFQVRAIIDHTAMVAPAIKSGLSSAYLHSQADHCEQESVLGIWQYASYLNHACIPNAHRAYLGDMMILRATRNIQANEELLIAYVDSTWHFDKRKLVLATLGIAECDCPLCQVERTLSPETLDKRKRAERDMRRFLEEDRKKTSFQRRPPCELVYDEWQALSDAMVATYDDELYADLPRFGVAEVDMWLCETAWTGKRALHSVQWLLRDMGIKTKTNDETGRMSMNRTCAGSGVFKASTIGALLGTVAAKNAVRDATDQRALAFYKKLAAEMHMTIFGEKLRIPPGLYDRPYAKDK